MFTAKTKPIVELRVGANNSCSVFTDVRPAFEVKI